MNSDVSGAILSIACLAATLVFIVRLRRRKAVYITDYVAGVRFRNGVFDGILPPGNYFSRDSGNQITMVDMRPYPFIFERMFYQDVLRANSVISVGGVLAVRDPHLAISALKDPVNDTLPIVREHLPLIASRAISDSSLDGRMRLTAAITAGINCELESQGMEIRNLEITELWAQPVKPDVAPVAN